MARWRVQPLPPEWVTQTRPRILARDGYRCTYQVVGVRCAKRATDVDHIIPVSQGGGEGDENLASLCQGHHRSKTGREGQSAVIQRKRGAEAHPGMVGG